MQAARMRCKSCRRYSTILYALAPAFAEPQRCHEGHAPRHLLDVLLFGETEEKAVLIMDYGKDVIQLEQRMAELAAADAARTKKHHERHAAAPEH